MANRYEARASDWERFWPKVRVSRACWAWLGWRNKDGYGRFWLLGRDLTAHRAAWILHTGEIPPTKMDVCHSCDNKGCVNPAHLRVGTRSENIFENYAKGRARVVRGEAQHCARFTARQVRQMRHYYDSGLCTQSEIARAAGVSQSHVQAILSRKSWRHVK